MHTVGWKLRRSSGICCCPSVFGCQRLLSVLAGVPRMVSAAKPAGEHCLALTHSTGSNTWLQNADTPIAHSLAK